MSQRRMRSTADNASHRRACGSPRSDPAKMDDDARRRPADLVDGDLPPGWATEAIVPASLDLAADSRRRSSCCGRTIPDRLPDVGLVHPRCRRGSMARTGPWSRAAPYGSYATPSGPSTARPPGGQLRICAVDVDVLAAEIAHCLPSAGSEAVGLHRRWKPASSTRPLARGRCRA